MSKTRTGSLTDRARAALLASAFLLGSGPAAPAAPVDAVGSVTIAQAAPAAPAAPQVQVNQQVVQSALILPTDVSSWGGERGRSRGLTHMEGPPDLDPWLFHGIAQSVERDPRYSFTGVWTSFGAVEKFVAKLEDKIPALHKVTGEIKSPCGDIGQSMPPLPDLPDPGAVGKKQDEQPQLARGIWAAIGIKPSDSAAQSAGHGRLAATRSCQGFSSGPEGKQRIVVAKPGTVALAKNADSIIVKVGRAYVYNGGTSDLEVESGRMSVMLPPGASGVVDTAANGLTQFVALTDSARRPINIVDLCNTSLELAKVDSGEFVTIAPEDAVVEDLISLHGISETADRVERKEGYLVVIGRFSMRDAVDKEATLQSPLFQSYSALKDQKAELVALAEKAPDRPAALTGQIAHAAEPAPESAARIDTSPSTGAVFMPTRGARYGTLGPSELMVADGAVLVKGAAQPVAVSAEVNRRKVMTEIRSGAVVMVSALDGRLTVLNLTDSGPGSVVIYMPGERGDRYRTIAVGMGQVAELYINDGLEPPNAVLAYRVIDKKNLPDGVGLLLAKYDYLAAMKRFNLSFALPSQDLSKVLKTMAATAYMQYSRR